VYQFGAFHLDAANRLLYRDGDLIPLPPKVFDTLLLLVTNSRQVLAKDEMMKRLWPDTFVEEGTLAQYIFLLRKALGDRATWIENHPRRGYRFTGPVEECDGERVGEHRQSHTVIKDETTKDEGRISRFQILVATLVIAGMVIVAAPVWSSRKETGSSSVGSVAVLPFRTVSDSGDDYRADGITDALITKLANLKGLRVVSYSRVRQFKGSSAEAAVIGRQLGVEAVIEGTVRVASGRMGLSVHAVDTKTADTLWADDRFETNLSGLLNMERQLAEAVALRLRRSLTAGERGLLTKSGTSNAEARDLVVRARAVLGEQEAARSDLPAQVLLDRAIRLDPGFAEAYGWLAFIQHRAYHAGMGGSGTLRAAISNATQSLARDPDNLTAMRALAHIQHSAGRAVEGLVMARRALENNPDDLDAAAAAAEAYFRTGLYERAIPLYERALAGEPENSEFRRQLARMYLFLGEYEQGSAIISQLPLNEIGPFGMLLYAETEPIEKTALVVRSVLQSYPNNPFSAFIGGYLLAEAGNATAAMEIWTQNARRTEHLLKLHENPHARAGLGWIYGRLGEREKALHQVREMLEPDPHHPVFLFFAAEIHALVENRRQALSALKAAVENGFFNLPMIDAMALLPAGTLRNLRDDPEFLEIRSDLARRIEQLREQY